MPNRQPSKPWKVSTNWHQTAMPKRGHLVLTLRSQPQFSPSLSTIVTKPPNGGVGAKGWRSPVRAVSTNSPTRGFGALALRLSLP